MMDDAYLDDLLDELVVMEPRADWNDVLARARRSQRRYVVLIAAIAALVLAPSAWGIWSALQSAPAGSGITLTAAETPTPPATEANAAVAAATAAFPNHPVESYQFAHCVDDQSVPRVDEDCWAVFLNPAGLVSHGPFGSKSRPRTYFLVLVDPKTDQVISDAAGSSPVGPLRRH